MRNIVFGCLITSLVACTTNSEKPVCGDGRIEGAEQCDDGINNGALGDSCSATCTIVAPFCGDGIVDTGEECDDGPNNGTVGDRCSATCTSVGYITANWSVGCVAGDTACTPGCPVGYDTAAVYSQRLDSNGQPVGQPLLDTFNCAAGTGKTAALTAGKYQEYIAITDHNGTMTFAQSLLDDVDITTVDGTFTEKILIDGGYFQVAWTLKGQLSANTLTCTQAATSTIDVKTTVTGPVTIADDLFACADGAGLTGELMAGTYTVSITAENAAMQVAGTSAAQPNKVIMDRNMVTDLGNIQVNITGL
jgi:cysteine-rich repeat protein